jgi:hypothetical protein
MRIVGAYLRAHSRDPVGIVVGVVRGHRVVIVLGCLLIQPVADCIVGVVIVQPKGFLYRHLPLGSRYCAIRLNTYGKHCGVFITPHQLRHSCATMLLNAGAPVLTVQAILGHKRIDTTLRYARLYDGTISADYYQAMDKIEARMKMIDNLKNNINTNQLLAVSMIKIIEGEPLSYKQLQILKSLKDILYSISIQDGKEQEFR